jgi:hypothetical protein
MLNPAKKLNAMGTKVFLQIFSPVCPLPHSYLLKNN